MMLGSAVRASKSRWAMRTTALNASVWRPKPLIRKAIPAGVSLGRFWP